MELINVHSDERRSIHLVKGLLENKEFTFINLRAGKAMGGCYHSIDEHYVVIEGAVIVWIGEDMKIAHAGDSGTFPKNTPHAFIALGDCIISEWGVSTDEKEADIKDSQMKKTLDEINNPK